MASHPKIVSRFLAASILAAAACQGSIGGTGRNPGVAAGSAGATGAAGGASTTGAAGDAAAAGTTGAAGTGLSPTMPPTCTGTPAPGRTPLRRLTRVEYANTVRDLLGDTSNVAATFPPEEEVSGFLNNADAYTTSDLHIQKYLDGAETVAAAARAAGKLTLPCKTTDAQKCATDFIKSFGLKALRRPLEDAEVASYLARYTMGATGGTFEEGLEWVVGRMLQSPSFLYRIEQDPAAAAGTPYAVSGYALATRLSYFLWETTPDDQLLADAGKGALATPEGIQAQVTRMMADAKFADTLSSFHDQWLGLAGVVGATKTATIVPAWSTTLQGELVREADLFIKDIYDTGGSLATLLTGTKGFVNKDLAQFYGVAGPADAATYMPVAALPNRHGVLTLPALLASLAHADQSAPVKRGKMIREQILCAHIPDPPNNLVITVPKVAPGSTTRQRFEMHRTEASCAVCHTLMDPLAMPLEYYDELGRYRTMDQGLPVDGSGQLTKTSAADPNVSTPTELGTKLAALPEAQSCMVFQWFRFAAGHTEEQADACTLAALTDRFAKSGQNLRDLLVGVTVSTDFRYRQD